MASRSRTATQGKEKRSGTSSPSNPTRSSRQSTSTSNSKPSIDKEKEKPEKPLPNYLKPTICSRNEPFQLVKKSNTHEQDPKFLRRRSFDSRQLPSSSSQKVVISPRRDSIGPVLRERKITVRSTSYNSSRTNSSAPKMVLDSRSTTSSRTTKGAAVKSQPLPSRSAKKSATSSTNNEKEHNVSPSVDVASSSHDTITQTLEKETEEEENESVVYEVEEIVKAEKEVDVQSDVPKPETVEDVVDDIPGETKVENNDEDDEKIKSCDISTVPESENVVQPAAPSRIEETAHEEEKSNEVDDVPQQETSKEEVRELEEITGNSTSLPEENIVEETKTEVEDQKVVDDNENNNKTEDQLASTEEAVGDEKKEVVEESEEVKAKEEKEQEQQVQEANNDDEDEKTKTKQENAPANLAITSLRQDQGQGKKESPTAYNDVIEETASKLLGKRKNKVRALVGAFETVIDCESASSTPKANN